MTTLRPLSRITQAHHQREGGGFVVRRPFPTQGLDHVDPFLLLDEMGPVDYAPGAAVGAPDHPHRGFETVTYMLEGAFEHRDSMGHHGALSPGDVQWMTAGSGIVHSEMPSEAIKRHGGRIHGFQIWVNLPSHLKMTAPRYQERTAAQIPRAQSTDGLTEVVVIAGEALGVSAAIDTHIPITLQHWRLQPGASVDTAVPPDHDVMAYVFKGTAALGPDGRAVAEGGLARFGDGLDVRLGAPPDADGPAELLLLSGRPIRQPVARYGPFVMNTVAELEQCFADFRAGRMGRIPAEHI